MTTPILELDEWQQNQQQPHITHNEAVRWLELFTQLIVLSASTTSPPTGVQDGDAYIVPENATDEWLGQDGKVALYMSTAWEFKQAPVGAVAWVKDIGARYRQNSALSWGAMLSTRTISGASGSLQTSDADSVIETTGGSAVTLEVSEDLDAYPIGCSTIIRQIGAGQVTVVPETTNVVVLRPSALSSSTRERYSTISISKRAANVYILAGDLEVEETS